MLWRFSQQASPGSSVLVWPYTTTSVRGHNERSKHLFSCKMALPPAFTYLGWNSQILSLQCMENLLLPACCSCGLQKLHQSSERFQQFKAIIQFLAELLSHNLFNNHFYFHRRCIAEALVKNREVQMCHEKFFHFENWLKGDGWNHHDWININLFLVLFQPLK